MVSTTEVTIGATKIPLAATDLERKVQTALDAMKAAGAPAGTVILQADVRSKGKTLNAIVLGAKRAGFDNVLFAVKNL